MPGILDLSDLSSCLWVLSGSLPTGPQFTTFLLQGVYEAHLFSLSLLLWPIPCHQSLSFPVTTVVVIWLFYLLPWQHCLWKTKSLVYALSLSLLSDAVFNVDYKAWRFFPSVGHWQATDFFFLSFFLSLQWGWWLLLATWARAVFLSHLPAASLPIVVQPFLSQNKYHFFRKSTLLPWRWRKTYRTHFLFFTVLYICVTSLLIL